MCKSQYDIEVEQQRMRIERKKERAAPFTYLSHSS
jgi:hypothetical protein